MTGLGSHRRGPGNQQAAQQIPAPRDRAALQSALLQPGSRQAASDKPEAQLL